MKLSHLSLIILAIFSFAGCDHFDDRVYFGGRYYPAKARSINDDRAQFSVSVSRLHQGMDGARQAAEYEATRYCVKNYGNSELIWVAAPDREVTTEELSGGSFVATGKCIGW